MADYKDWLAQAKTNTINLIEFHLSLASSWRLVEAHLLLINYHLADVIYFR